MTLRLAYFFDLVFCLVISLLAGVHGRTRPQRPSLTLMTQNGQMYNCVGLYRQSAFNHPLLKDHVPKGKGEPNISYVCSRYHRPLELIFGATEYTTAIDIWSAGCVLAELLLGQPLFLGESDADQLVEIIKHFQDINPYPQEDIDEYAVVRTVLDNTNKQFFGSNASPNLYKPKVQGYQWSASRIKLMNGPDSIEAGWIVFPDYYKDNEAHFYARFSAGSNGCFNTDCSGFVQVATDLPLGSSPQEYSSIKGRQVTWNISIDKHLDDGNWWLSMTWDSGTHQIGYWPASLFTVLNDAAAQVEWGGEINNPGAISPAPSMGSSLKAIYDVSLSAHFQHITVVDDRSNNVVPQGTEKFYDCPRLYTVLDWGGKGGDLGRVIFYGGSQSDDL